MSDIGGRQSDSWLFLAALTFMFVGIAWNPLFLACSIFFLSAAEYRRNRIMGAIGAAAGLVFLLLVLGYGLGKNLALRDNARTAVERPVHVP